MNPVNEKLPPLLAADEPEPASVYRPHGRSAYFLTCDHASNRIPRALGDMGLSAAELQRHIAWDIGALAVAKRMSDALDATLVYQNYSRLVIDCNRSPGVPAAIPEVSEHTTIPANLNLTAAEAQRRERAIHTPYHQCIQDVMEQRAAAQQPSLYVAMHSYTPVFKGSQRHWHMSVMYHRDRRLAALLLDSINATAPHLVVGDNEPYHVDDKTDYGIPVHGEKRGIPHVLIELRQDLIEHEAGQQEWAERCTDWLQRMLPRMQEVLPNWPDA